MAVGRFLKPALALACLFASCSLAGRGVPEGAEARSLDGRPLVAPTLPGDVLADRERRLAEAELELASRPDARDAWIWVGRRLGYLGRYRDAIDVFGRALERWPGDAFLLRHRGHRWISVREFGRAVVDLTRAAEACRTTPDEVEPDGLPVAGRPPHSSLHFNVHYHLGLAHFLLGDFAAAERAWLDCLACSDDDESRVAVSHWLWSVRMRRGDPAGAGAVVQWVRPDVDVVENVAYRDLCLLYRGALEPAALAAGDGSSGAAARFGLAHYRLVTGDAAAARSEFEALAADPGWAAFGVIAAEAELAR